MNQPRLAIVSPFLDKRHGTERCVAEQIERLADGYEIHLYSQQVEDVDLRRIVWHHVPALPGPHLLAYCWWIIANHLRRWWDARFRNLGPAMIYSPGINCFDADVVSVHVVFGAYIHQAGKALEFRGNPVRFWPRLLHRRIYYRLIVALERLLYAPPTRQANPLRKIFPRFVQPMLTAISGKAARNLQRYGRAESEVPVIVYGIDPQRFKPEARQLLRESARQALALQAGDFALLLVGNDWRNKGLPCLLESLGKLPQRSIRLLIVGTDTVEPYRETIARLHLEGRASFLPVRSDVEFYYAAADLYAGPSLNDAFALPPLEAMACGVPAIVSSQAGVSEVVKDGVNGFILDDSRDSGKLAALIALLYENETLRHKIGEAASETARQYTWDRNARQLSQLLQKVLRHKSGKASIALVESNAVMKEKQLL